VALEPLSFCSPRCSLNATAIVHHGGIGTTALALRAGKPMLVIPGEYSQSDTAARLERLGVARVILRTQFNGASVAAELSALLVTPGYRQAADGRSSSRHPRGWRQQCLRRNRGGIAGETDSKSEFRYPDFTARQDPDRVKPGTRGGSIANFERRLIRWIDANHARQSIQGTSLLWRGDPFGRAVVSTISVGVRACG
jgi:hypothetical protein